MEKIKQKIIELTKAYSQIGKSVKIIPIGLTGKIIGIYANDWIVDYQVLYYFNTDQKRMYFSLSELEVIEEPKKELGFNNEK